MRFKLDENFPKSIKELFSKAGFDADSVSDEKLNGVSDRAIFQVCATEKTMSYHP